MANNNGVPSAGNGANMGNAYSYLAALGQFIPSNTGSAYDPALSGIKTGAQALGIGSQIASVAPGMLGMGATGAAALSAAVLPVAGVVAAGTFGYKKAQENAHKQAQGYQDDWNQGNENFMRKMIGPQDKMIKATMDISDAETDFADANKKYERAAKWDNIWGNLGQAAKFGIGTKGRGRGKIMNDREQKYYDQMQEATAKKEAAQSTIFTNKNTSTLASMAQPTFNYRKGGIVRKFADGGTNPETTTTTTTASPDNSNVITREQLNWNEFVPSDMNRNVPSKAMEYYKNAVTNYPDLFPGYTSDDVDPSSPNFSLERFNQFRQQHTGDVNELFSAIETINQKKQDLNLENPPVYSGGIVLSQAQDNLSGNSTGFWAQRNTTSNSGQQSVSGSEGMEGDLYAALLRYSSDLPELRDTKENKDKIERINAIRQHIDNLTKNASQGNYNTQFNDSNIDIVNQEAYQKMIDKAKAIDKTQYQPLYDSFEGYIDQYLDTKRRRRDDLEPFSLTPNLHPNFLPAEETTPTMKCGGKVQKKADGGTLQQAGNAPITTNSIYNIQRDRHYRSLPINGSDLYPSEQANFTDSRSLPSIAPLLFKGPTGQPNQTVKVYKQNTEQQYAQGGAVQLKGPGTGTSDSIPDKIEPGAFVVPAKNADIAKMLLGGNVPKVNKVGDSTGVPVKVSNTEIVIPKHMADRMPQAVKEVLAPDAQYVKKGGMIKGYAGAGTVTPMGNVKQWTDGNFYRVNDKDEFIYDTNGKPILAEQYVNQAGNTAKGTNYTQNGPTTNGILERLTKKPVGEFGVWEGIGTPSVDKFPDYNVELKGKYLDINQKTNEELKTDQSASMESILNPKTNTTVSDVAADGKTLSNEEIALRKMMERDKGPALISGLQFLTAKEPKMKDQKDPSKMAIYPRSNAEQVARGNFNKALDMFTQGLSEAEKAQYQRSAQSVYSQLVSQLVSSGMPASAAASVASKAAMQLGEQMANLPITERKMKLQGLQSTAPFLQAIQQGNAMDTQNQQANASRLASLVLRKNDAELQRYLTELGYSKQQRSMALNNLMQAVQANDYKKLRGLIYQLSNKDFMTGATEYNKEEELYTGENSIWDLLTKGEKKEALQDNRETRKNS